MPHKPNANRRHHIPQMSFKVLNWPAYEAGQRRRGSLTLWIEDGALEHWRTRGQCGQARDTDAAIQTNLMLGAAFKLALRRTKGLMASVITLMGARRNDDGPLQGADRTAAASTWLCRPADRSWHRRRGPEPDAGGRTPEIHSSPAGRHRDVRSLSPLTLHPPGAPPLINPHRSETRASRGHF